ncbi:MAG: hypothetical protein HQK76_15440 [Desulfobacterales bacterium]|nr:hypothetical protein [Desulfobacterales bacterium]
MSNGTKLILVWTIIFGLMFGFLPVFFKGQTFERLHIFLFNLCAGGTIILNFTEKGKPALLFFCGALIYAIFAFFEYYLASILIALILFVIVERVRIKKFSFFPYIFFKNSAKVSEKFHHASLLCLSIGLLISAFAILDSQYLKWVNSPKLTLNTFFLGFSFPLSLITFFAVFSFIPEDTNKFVNFLKNFCFWALNLGVIIFFAFILFEIPYLELFISIVLLCSVGIVFYLHLKFGENIQQKYILISGILFLFLTAITGIIYILYYLSFEPFDHKVILKLHAVYSLYGWNLSGLIIIVRFNEFPLSFNMKKALFIHWLTVGIIAPFGYYYELFGIIALILYSIFLYSVFFNDNNYTKK